MKTIGADSARGKDHRTFCTFLRRRTAAIQYGEKTPVGVRPSLTNEQLVDLLARGQYTLGPGWLRKFPPRLTNADYAAHRAGEATYYYVADGRRDTAEALLLLDLDVHHGVGSHEGAMAFADFLRADYFPGMHVEPSTSGVGAHGYVRVGKAGVGGRALNARFRGCGRWLQEQARKFGADISGAEVRGAATVLTWGRGGPPGAKAPPVGAKAGRFAKVPRGLGVLDTCGVALDDLPRVAKGDSPRPARKARAFPATSWSALAITPADLADVPRLATLAGTLGVPDGVSAEDLGVYLLLLRFFARDRNPDGSLPSARFRALWDALFHAGDVGRAFHNGRFAAVTRHLTSRGLLVWEDPHFRTGRARRWGPSDQLLSRIAPGPAPAREGEREEASFAISSDTEGS
jgi:hypothetical protein